LHGVFSKSLEVIPCEGGRPGYSFFFDLIAPIWRGCKAEGAVHRLCSLMRKMGARTLLKERLEPSEEICGEFEDLQKRIGKEFSGEPEAHRLSFFAESCRRHDWQSLSAASFLGYAVVLSVRLPRDVDIVKEVCPSGDLAYLLEAVTRPPGWAVRDKKSGVLDVHRVTNYYVHCQRRFPTTIGSRADTRDLCVEGALFCQQNGITHVCAHAVLRMLINTADLVGHKVTNRELNDTLGIDHHKRFANRGLTADQVLEIIEHFGLSVIGGDFVTMPTVDYAEWIYPLIESGYPVFLTFNPTHTTGHVIAVLGHTVNSDKWDCEAHLAYRPEAFGTYHASAAWVDHFIVNDDNFGMYTCMPPQYLRNKILPQYDRTQRARVALSILPSGIDVLPYNAEKVSVSLVANLPEVLGPGPANKWLARLWEQLEQRNKGIVARTQLCAKADYVAFLRSQTDSDGNGPVSRIPEALEPAPDYMWLTEISLPDLYTANKHKLGDLLIDAKEGKSDGKEFYKFVWGWLPGVQVTSGASGGVCASSWPLTGHIPILRSKRVLGPYFEW
jgi:hypothetical protein